MSTVFSRSRSFVKPLSSVLLGVGVVVSALQLGPEETTEAYAATMPVRYYNEGEMPEYPGSVEFPLGDGMTVNGATIQISQFSVNDSPEKVKNFYVDEFKVRGVEATSSRSDDGTINVVAPSSDGQTQYVFAILPKPSGKGSVVFPSAQPLDGELLANDEDSDIPFSPKAVGVMRVKSKDEQGGTVTYQEPALRTDEVTAFVSSTMATRGWAQKESHRPSGTTNIHTLEFRRGAIEAHFTISSYEKSKAGSAVFVRYGPAGETP